MFKPQLLHLLNHLGEDWATESEGLDNNGLIGLTHSSGTSLILAYVPVPTETLALYGDVTTLEDDAGLRHAFEKMHFWTGFEIPTLGLVPGTNDLAATRIMELTQEVIDNLPAILDEMISDMVRLEEELGRQRDAEAPQSAVNPNHIRA